MSDDGIMEEQHPSPGLRSVLAALIAAAANDTSLVANGWFVLVAIVPLVCAPSYTGSPSVASTAVKMCYKVKQFWSLFRLCGQFLCHGSCGVAVEGSKVSSSEGFGGSQDIVIHLSWLLGTSHAYIIPTFSTRIFKPLKLQAERPVLYSA